MDNINDINNINNKNLDKLARELPPPRDKDPLLKRTAIRNI